jgi:hypothetical protein
MHARKPFGVIFGRFVLAASIVVAALAPAAAGVQTAPAFERLENTWAGLTDYSMTIDAHEVLGDQTADSELRYAFKRPNQARLDVLKGLKSGSTMVLDGVDRVIGYYRRLSLFKTHGGAQDKNLTSLRGNGILNPNLGEIVSCFGAHREELRQAEGPDVDGQLTDEISLPYEHVECSSDSSTDRGTITLDVLDISRDTGLVMERKRYVGNEAVETWQLSDYKLNSGLTDSDLR